MSDELLKARVLQLETQMKELQEIFFPTRKVSSQSICNCTCHRLTASDFCLADCLCDCKQRDPG